MEKNVEMNENMKKNIKILSAALGVVLILWGAVTNYADLAIGGLFVLSRSF